MNRYAILAVAIVAGVALVAGAAVTTTLAQKEDRVPQELAKNMKYRDYKDGVFKVRAGAGGATAPLTRFLPAVAEIKVGESVMWYNPTRVGEPHTVTFLSNQTYFADIAAPFVIDGNATSLVPGANAKAAVMAGPGGKNVIVGINGRSLNPVVISADGTVTGMQPNAPYTMKGDEQYVNSGWLWPDKQVPQGLPSITSFEVKFEQAGTYDYVCAIHPWMTGQVVVVQ
ncbi:MAG: hypothetical protein ABI347_03065 [Nitrososphaera sp.]|jgi:plastocyanin